MAATRIPGTKRTKNGNIAAYIRVGGRSGRQIQKTFPRGTQRYFIDEWRASVRKKHETEKRDPGSLADAIDL